MKWCSDCGAELKVSDNPLCGCCNGRVAECRGEQLNALIRAARAALPELDTEDNLATVGAVEAADRLELALEPFVEVMS